MFALLFLRIVSCWFSFLTLFLFYICIADFCWLFSLMYYVIISKMLNFYRNSLKCRESHTDTEDFSYIAWESLEAQKFIGNNDYLLFVNVSFSIKKIHYHSSFIVGQVETFDSHFCLTCIFRSTST